MSPGPKDEWDPRQYRRFDKERKQPFLDLLRLVDPVPGGRVVDLGCGTGELTTELHQHSRARHTVGLDRSAAMLAEAAASEGVRFEGRDVASVPPDLGEIDLAFSNACLQWLPDHLEVIGRWSAAIKPGGQLAVQVPANSDHASHKVAAEVAALPEFASAFAAGPPADPVVSIRPPEDYAELLYGLGFTEQHVRLQVYGHVLESSAEVVEWVKGTSLTRLKPELGDQFERFVSVYRDRLIEAIGHRRPYFYAFKRILMWGRKA